jgi:hypothetical protein
MGISSRATKGKVTNTVARIIPGTAKIILISWSNSQSPNHPFLPKSRTNTNPDITGETAKGKSINEVRMLLPLKLNFAISHDAAIPKIILQGTAIKAVNNVSFIAEKVSGSAIEFIYASHPFSNAFTNTNVSGTHTKIPMNKTVAVIRIILITNGSVSLTAVLLTIVFGDCMSFFKLSFPSGLFVPAKHL